MTDETFTVTIHVADGATDSEVETTREIAVLAWREAVTEAGLTAGGDPVATLELDAAPGSSHRRGWVVTGAVGPVSGD